MHKREWFCPTHWKMFFQRLPGAVRPSSGFGARQKDMGAG
jgi:hypothetical protein